MKINPRILLNFNWFTPAIFSFNLSNIAQLDTD